MRPGAPPRVVIARVAPQLDCGRWPVKRVVGDVVAVTADVFADGHDRLAAELRWRVTADAAWQAVSMTAAGDDRWHGAFRVDRLGTWEFTIEAWVDRFASWRTALEKKVGAGRDVASELLEGAALVRAAAARAADAADAAWLTARAEALAAGHGAQAARVVAALDPRLADELARHPDREGAATLARPLPVLVERERARSGAWYELFPRSAATEPGRHGTLRDVAARLPAIAAMGFEVVYLPPIHPIGRTHRKGPNNQPAAGPDDPGSPWAIGAAEGGHTAVHPALGTLDDVDALVAAARTHDLELALDVAFQCAPDHPWVREHPEWFRRRPDGSIQYAENPPKQYQDIYPLDFACEAREALWAACRDVILFWAARGVRIFRVDNPHTKAFAFWEWCLTEVRAVHPDAVFLSEAFTRPRVLEHLAKLGFSQSYTYFTWRNTKWELETYCTELVATERREYLRPNFFANTPDILPEPLQHGGRPTFAIRLILAATLAASWGIYGPPFERCVGDALPGSEEYRDSEKYQLRHWPDDAPWSLGPLAARLNAIRRAHPAFRIQETLAFHPADNPELLFFSRATPDGTDVILVVVSLDPRNPQSGWLDVPLARLGLDPALPYQVHDLLGDARWLWHGARNFVALDPAAMPAHVLRVHRHLRREHDFDYWM